MAQDFSARVYTSRIRSDLESEMVRIGADSSQSAQFLSKIAHICIKVHNVPAPIAIDLREQVLANGGVAVCHRHCSTVSPQLSDMLISADREVFDRILSNMEQSEDVVSDLVTEISRALTAFCKEAPALPSPLSLTEPLRTFYADLRKRTLVMGIVNVTPDSFSDGGLYSNPETAIEHGLRMVEEGADLLDVGGESSRPGAQPVSAEEELARVLPVVNALASSSNVPISIDTRKPDVARAALNAGASIINDITGLADFRMRLIAAERRVPCVIMHMRGTPQTMQDDTEYSDVIAEIYALLARRVGDAISAGLPEEYIIVDPGIGFGKTPAHNLEIIRKLGDFRSLGRPILIGTSRKAFVGKYAGGDLPPEKRAFGTAATVALAIANGASIVRVHDVREMVQVVRMADAVVRGAAT